MYEEKPTTTLAWTESMSREPCYITQTSGPLNKHQSPQTTNLIGPGQWVMAPIILEDSSFMDDVIKRVINLEKKLENTNK